MNNQALEDKIRTLRQLAPSDDTINEIKDRVHRMTGIPVVTRRSYRYLLKFFYPAIAVIVIVSILPVYRYIVNKDNPLYFAKVEVSNAVNTFRQADSTELILTQEVHLDRAQKQIASLNLNGVPGKYTKEECYDLYHQYEKYLRSYKAQLEQMMSSTTSDDPRLASVHSKIVTYEAENELKWPR